MKFMCITEVGMVLGKIGFPERRGNGLKFVRRVINGNSNRGLFCQSGSGTMFLGGLANEIEKELSSKMNKDNAVGTITFIRWNT